jgi:hypothetical protein
MGKLILSSMPHLRIFDMECALGQPGDYKLNDIPEINMFQSSFWSQRHWLFTYGIESRLFNFVRVIRSSYPYRYNKNYCFIRYNHTFQFKGENFIHYMEIS